MWDNLSSCTSSTPCSAFCPRLTQSVFFLLCCFSSAAWSHSILFPFLTPMFAGSFMGHFENTIVPYRQLQKLHFENTMVPYQQVNIYVAMRLPRNTRAFSNFSQCGYCYSTNANLLMVQCTNTYIHTPLAFNMLMRGSLRLAPITTVACCRCLYWLGQGLGPGSGIRGSLS